MSIDSTTTLDDLRATLEAIQTGKPLDPEVESRIRDRTDAVRRRLPETDVAVDLIREVRDE